MGENIQNQKPETLANTRRPEFSNKLIGLKEFEAETLFNNFLQSEKLDGLEILYKLILPPFYNGRVKKAKINVG